MAQLRITNRYRTDYNPNLETLKGFLSVIRSPMDKNHFKATVQRATHKLLERGYKIQEESPFYTVEFQKTPVTGVFCLIGFDLFRIETVPNEFKILLVRRRLEDFAHEDSYYKPLIIDLRNLMIGLYKMDIFPPRQYAWQFIDKNSLRKQVENAEDFIIEYGIKWLEDPMSNLDWLGQ